MNASTCPINSTCTNTIGSFFCTCNPGFRNFGNEAACIQCNSTPNDTLCIEQRERLCIPRESCFQSSISKILQIISFVCKILIDNNVQLQCNIVVCFVLYFYFFMARQDSDAGKDA